MYEILYHTPPWYDVLNESQLYSKCLSYTINLLIQIKIRTFSSVLNVSNIGYVEILLFKDKLHTMKIYCAWSACIINTVRVSLTMCVGGVT